MFGTDRNQLRRMYFDSWRKHLDGAPLDAMQQVIVNVIGFHPEYHSLLDSPDALERDYTPETGETNPFLHMSMHIALHEQISTDRPPGLKAAYMKLCSQKGSAHEAEHAMMECLGEALWMAQRNKSLPDETAYLGCVQNLIKGE